MTNTDDAFVYDESLITHAELNDSELVEGAYYDAQSKSLLLDLSYGTYRYDDVSDDTWESFKAANSKGRFVNLVLNATHKRYPYQTEDTVKREVVPVVADATQATTVNVAKSHFTYTFPGTPQSAGLASNNYEVLYVLDDVRVRVARVTGATDVEAVKSVTSMLDNLGLEYTLKEVKRNL